MIRRPAFIPGGAFRQMVALALWLGAGVPATGGTPMAGKLDYDLHVRPILADRCFPCHGPDEKKRKAKLRLDTPGGAVAAKVVVAGKPEESELIERITATDETRMPPPDSHLSLNGEEIERIRRWISEGAEYRPHWAFRPLSDRVPVPKVSDPRWTAGPIDCFILAQLEQEGLKPSLPAAREDWIRRATFDLTGLPPSPTEVDAFLADRSPCAFEKVVDRLLGSPRFGERMASDWLDVARYADSFGYQADGDTHLWPWRDWVVKAFNVDLPFDRFILWQLAGDLLDRPTREQRLATAFCRLHRMTNEGGSVPEEFRQEYVVDRVQTFGTAFLGLTIECARCHDHKYDPLTMRNYYGLGAFFNSIDEWGTYADSRFRPTPTLLLPTPEQEHVLAGLEGEVARAEARLRAVERSAEGRFQAWLAAPGLTPEIPGLVGHYPLDKIAEGRWLENLDDPKNRGETSAGNVTETGKIGRALQCSGDDVVRFPRVLGHLERSDPFTVSFWLQTPGILERGVVFHREDGTDVGVHGTELSFDEGRLFFGLIRFWPGNAVAIRTRRVLPAKTWVHVAVSSDGSGRAAGLRIDLDGQPAAADVVRDCLEKDLEASGTGLDFGARFRSPGFKQGRIDEVRVFARALTLIEVAQLRDGLSLAEALTRRDVAALRPYYFSVADPAVAKARAELRGARQRLFAAKTGVFEIMTMEEQPHPRPAFILARGRYDAPQDKPVGRLTPEVLPPFPNGSPRNRLGLARWLIDSKHPLTARVAVNRIWQLFFGRGIVATPENFGVMGTRPSHPELLDWMARDLVASGWSIKALCKSIVLSSTYRQRSAVAPEARHRDPDNLLMARGPSRRLSAEMLRDAALAIGGLLVEQLGGPPAKPYQPPGLWKGQNAFLPDYQPDRGRGLYRRSLYSFWRRTSPLPNMTTLDAPSRETCVVRRQLTSTALQPLVTLNDPQFVEAARGLGEQMLRIGGSTVEERTVFAFRCGCTRRPTSKETSLLTMLYHQQLGQFRQDVAAAKSFLRTGERPPEDTLDPAELAASTVIANAVLNLDAAVVTR
jgi:hypothetical protein